MAAVAKFDKESLLGEIAKINSPEELCEFAKKDLSLEKLAALTGLFPVEIKKLTPLDETCITADKLPKKTGTYVFKGEDGSLIHDKELSDSDSTKDQFVKIEIIEEPTEDSPINIFGDIHGTLADLEAILTHSNLLKNKSRAIFCGDYGDRGNESNEVYVGISALKDKFLNAGEPKKVFLIKGNHDERFFYPNSGILSKLSTTGTDGRYEQNDLVSEIVQNMNDNLFVNAVFFGNSVASHAPFAVRPSIFGCATIRDIRWNDPFSNRRLCDKWVQKQEIFANAKIMHLVHIFNGHVTVDEGDNFTFTQIQNGQSDDGEISQYCAHNASCYKNTRANFTYLTVYPNRIERHTATIKGSDYKWETTVVSGCAKTETAAASGSGPLPAELAKPPVAQVAPANVATDVAIANNPHNFFADHHNCAAAASFLLMFFGLLTTPILVGIYLFWKGAKMAEESSSQAVPSR